jgi:hypothetical protein
MTADQSTDTERRRFRRTLVRVLIVQGVSLLLLGLLQSRYGAS